VYPVLLLFGIAVGASILGMAGVAASAAMIAKVLLSLFIFALVLACVMLASRRSVR
jgi:uncharacterized membrane protein YtjA (UPF0391 family)